MLLGSERAGLELKAHDLLKRSTFRRKPELRELVESVFDQLRNLPVTIFAVTMHRPTQVIPRQDTHLPRQYRYVLQRLHALLLACKTRTNSRPTCGHMNHIPMVSAGPASRYASQNTQRTSKAGHQPVTTPKAYVAHSARRRL